MVRPQVFWFWLEVSAAAFLILFWHGQILKAVAEVTAQYDDGFTEQMLAALFKIQDPAAMLALWKQSGLLKTT